MKIGAKLILVISIVNLVGIGGLTIAATLISSSRITAISDENANNITAVTAGAVKAQNMMIRVQGLPCGIDTLH